jgi:hypothetical protein
MGDPYRDRVFSFASQFRAAILATDPSTNPLVTLQHFPHGACADASLLLAKFLQVRECGLSLFMLGRRSRQCHAWLQLQHLVVDITADQFHDQSAAVIVSSNSSWHETFAGNIHSVADFCLYDRNTVFQLTRAYETITRRLDKAN